MTDANRTTHSILDEARSTWSPHHNECHGKQLAERIPPRARKGESKACRGWCRWEVGGPLFTSKGLQSSEPEALGTADWEGKAGDGDENQEGSLYYDQSNSTPILQTRKETATSLILKDKRLNDVRLCTLEKQASRAQG